jgi:hypothetical protein
MGTMENRLIVVTVISAMAVAGCSPRTSGTAEPSSPVAPTSQASTHPEVHKVAQPLDPSKFEATPCGLVPRDVMTGLGFSGAGSPKLEGETVSGPSCGWINSDDGRNLSVTLETGNRKAGIGGLAGLYTGRDSGQMPFLEPAPEVSGYQAVYADQQDRRPRGACDLHVGIADDLVFTIGDQGYSGARDSCDAAGQVAVAVVKTLKGA